MRFFAAAVAVGSLVVGSVVASPVLYGEVHFSINKFDQLNGGELRMDSHHSSIGIKGSEDLDHGVRLVYKAEFGYDTSNTNGLSDGSASTEEVSSFKDRDQWLGFASKDWGVIRFGTISTGYKSSGARLDPLYKTIFEQRGYLGLQSSLHDGEGVNAGRSDNFIRLDSKRWQGAKFVAGYSLGEGVGNTATLGMHYELHDVKFNVDYLKSESLSASAYKVGFGYAITPAFSFSAQYESADEILFDGAIAVAHQTLDLGKIDTVYKVDMSYVTGNSAWVFAYGVQDNYSGSYLLAWDHKLSSETDVYLGYAVKGFDRRGVSSDTVFGFGLRHKF